jgi:hypothetical protein
MWNLVERQISIVRRHFCRVSKIRWKLSARGVLPRSVGGGAALKYSCAARHQSESIIRPVVIINLAAAATIAQHPPGLS